MFAVVGGIVISASFVETSVDCELASHPKSGRQHRKCQHAYEENPQTVRVARGQIQPPSPSLDARLLQPGGVRRQGQSHIKPVSTKSGLVHRPVSTARYLKR